MNSVVRRLPAALLVLGTLAIPAVPAAEVTPQKVKAALPELEKLAQQILKKTGVPGLAVAVVYKDRVVYLKGFGVRQAGKDEPVDADTVFQLASVSKPIASTILAILVSLGLIDWDERVIDLDPDFRLYDPWVTREVTLRDLLCHRSGLPDHGGDLLEDLGYSRAQVLHRLRYLKPASSFRSRYAYTNFGYTAATVAAARTTRKSWEDLAADKLYRPLGMKSTSSRFADYAAARNRALLHVRVEGKWVARYVRDPDAQSPAGGVSSTARDLAQWMRLQLAGGKFDGKQLIAARALGETHRPQIISSPPGNPATDRAGFYGLGWNVNYDDQGRVRLGHSGGFDLGAATVVTLLPSEGLGIAVLTNASPIGVPETISASFFDLVLHGKVQKDWGKAFQQAFEALNKPAYGTAVDYRKPPARPSPPLPPEAYVGTYGNAYYGAIEVREKGGALLLRMGPKKTAFPLRHWDRDVFLYQPEGEMAGGLSGVTFRIGPARKGVQVVVENLDLHGQGKFARAAAGK
jgi:CubicO group peptidase (beta-lactamase class C family)